MSGSSLDGLDIVFVELEEKGGKWAHKILEADCIPYDKEWYSKLCNASSLSASEFVKLHADYGHLCGQMIHQFMEDKKLDYKVGLVASHGHTVFHVPGSHTVQIGDGAAIAAKTSLPVVSDLRALDVALGGQGAPIVPMGEKLLFSEHSFFLNIGGIANISFNGQNSYDAFDVCPANRVLNMIAAQKGLDFDQDGALASQGRIQEELLESLNAMDYYQQPFPKSLANQFGTDIVYPLIKATAVADEDQMATYVEHIAIQVVKSVEAIFSWQVPEQHNQQMMITGGGALNGYLVSRIGHHLAPLGISVEVPDQQTVLYKEALIMALLGVLRWREEETVLQSVTGASRASVGGALWMGSN
jgi:anhydro-N-acetylmuramic acid kinase